MKSDNDKRAEMSRVAFDNTDDDSIIMMTTDYIREHVKCIRLGDEITINDFGCWCSGDDPMPGEDE